ncbi:hypothetical protein Enr13x_21000 [Stieleria neptunia]|uniref:Uncharacterized protein n=2 Tax=Stieleria neptunia TaxID=2527979 RepID=A0A518HN23_9BACT|nr:hypothetical protein Enr13x_21000 [Stieleria neptunia]
MNSYYDQRYIFSVMRSCRDANDIPRFACSRIVVQKKGRDGSLFYVPQGNHKLLVRANWQKREKGTRAIDVLHTEYPEAPNQTWTIKLQGDSGYYCHWLSDDDPGTIGWRLTSNNETFEAVSHDLPLLDFAESDVSWTNGGTEMRFPNALMDDDRSDRPSASVSLGHWDRIGKNDNETWHVRFAAELVSDTPAVICAKSTEWYEGTNERKVIGEYVGDGRFLFLSQ